MIWLDLGYYYGAATELMQPAKDWTLYGFESNPEIEVPDWVSRDIVWIRNGNTSFKLNRDRNDASSVKGTTGMGSFDIIKARCIDFSAFVAHLPDDVIVCSMDIEGAEFKVLEKMLKDGTMDKITVLDIEFHHRLMNDYDDKNALDLMRRVQDRGVIVMLKVPLK